MTDDLNSNARPAPTPGGRSPGDGRADSAPLTPEQLVSALDAIEHRPLEERAAAYGQLHDRLRGRLEGGDVPRSTDA